MWGWQHTASQPPPGGTYRVSLEDSSGRSPVLGCPPSPHLLSTLLSGHVLPLHSGILRWGREMGLSSDYSVVERECVPKEQGGLGREGS